jgi:hypothetical protein
MADDDPHQELNRALSEFESLRASFAALQNNELVECHAFVDQLDEIRRLRLESLEAFHEQEKQLAQQAYESSLYANENDFTHNVGSLSDRIRQVLQFKFNIRAEEMPEPIKYFRSRAHETDSPFAVKFCRRSGGTFGRTVNGLSE